jgi:hypothetical protein
MSNQSKYQDIIDMTTKALVQLKAENGDKRHILLLEELHSNTVEMKRLDCHHNRVNDMRIRALNKANIPLFLGIAKYEGTHIAAGQLKVLGR